jgi:hypothetical protein
VGILRKPKRAAVLGFWSTLSFASRTRPASSDASSRSGRAAGWEMRRAHGW